MVDSVGYRYNKHTGETHGHNDQSNQPVLEAVNDVNTNRTQVIH